MAASNLEDLRNQFRPAEGVALASGPRIHAVAMPLVRLMRDGGLSWSDKEEVASVIRDLLREKKSMEDEVRHLTGAAAGMARVQGGGSGG